MEREMGNKVQLDGDAIRRIREQQKLTQFYIAKVVGVTTDTVSRWENNRYPSVRQENARLLAEALEVEVEQILLKPAAEPETEAVPLWRRWLPVWAGLGLVLIVTVIWWLNRAPVVPYSLTVVRQLPSHAAIQTQLPVRVKIDASGPIDGMVLREEFPKGFRLIEASPQPSSLDNDNGSARWFLQPGDKTLMVSYLLEPDPALTQGGGHRFNGEMIVNSEGENYRSVVHGGIELSLVEFHWADENRDRKIDDAEALEASVLSIAMKDVGVDWEQIEAIWGAGGYRLDTEKRRFVPQPPAGD